MEYIQSLHPKSETIKHIITTEIDKVILSISVHITKVNVSVRIFIENY